MRYWKRSIALSATQDYPLLRPVLRSTFITHRQLYDLLKLDSHARSRNAFNNRVRRLTGQQSISGPRRGSVWNGRLCVFDFGKGSVRSDCFRRVLHRDSKPPERERLPNAVYHAIELNEIHLALKRSQQLVRWMPDTEIRSRNELTEFGYRKDYDAVVTVRTDGGERIPSFATIANRDLCHRHAYLE